MAGLKDLAKNTFILASPKFLAFFLRIVTAKLNALFIGAFGVGIVNQIQSVNNQLSSFSVLSLNVGAKKLIVSHHNEEGKRYIPRIVTMFTLAILFFSLVVFILGLIFYDKLSAFFLGEDAKQYFIYVFVFFPLIALTTVPQTVLGALQKFRYLAGAEIIIKVISFLTFLPLIFFFGLTGVVINIAFTIVLTFGLFYYSMQQKAAKDEGMKLFNFKKIGLPRAMLRELGVVSSISSILGILAVFVELTIRGTLATKLGIEQIGIYAPIIAWSGFFSSLFLPALFQYIFPRYGKCESNEELVDVANSAFRLLTFLIIPFVLFVVSLVEFLLPLLYSKEFLAASDYFPLHFIGILFWTWMRILKQMFIPIGKIKELIPFALAEQILYLLVVLLLVDRIGLWSWTLRFSIVPLIIFIGFLLYMRKDISFRIEPGNALLMTYGILTICCIGYLRTVIAWSVLPAVLFSGLLYFFLRASEKRFLLDKVHEVYGKFKSS